MNAADNGTRWIFTSDLGHKSCDGTQGLGARG